MMSSTKMLLLNRIAGYLQEQLRNVKGPQDQLIEKLLTIERNLKTTTSNQIIQMIDDQLIMITSGQGRQANMLIFDNDSATKRFRKKSPNFLSKPPKGHQKLRLELLFNPKTLQKLKILFKFPPYTLLFIMEILLQSINQKSEIAVSRFFLVIIGPGHQCQQNVASITLLRNKRLFSGKNDRLKDRK